MSLLPTDAFVPLMAKSATAENGERRVTLLSAADTARPFKALELPATPPLSPPPAEKICEPRVLIQRDGERVTGLRIQCSCGQIMDVACVYEPPAP
jgi:hypothetical protein